MSKKPEREVANASDLETIVVIVSLVVVGGTCFYGVFVILKNVFL